MGPPSDPVEDTGDDASEASEVESEPDTSDTSPDSPPGPCPPHMALVDDRVCVDRYEAALDEQIDGAWGPASPYDTVGARIVRARAGPDQVPQGYISGDQAEIACENAGKRLCTSAEWLLACQGPAGTTYPYGDAHQSGACNDAYAGHPVVDYYGTSDGVWTTAAMNDPGINQQPGTLARGGAFPECASAWGIYDLHGNLHEWVDDADGVFRGGFYADASRNGAGCTYRTGAHARGYHDYSTGFRCCADPAR